MSFQITQYEQLSQDVRNFEVRLYLTPLALLTILGFSLRYALELPDSMIKLALTAFLVVVSHALTTYFIKTSIHQRAIKEVLDLIESQNGGIPVGRTTAQSKWAQNISRDEYSTFSPLWIYFYRSADLAISLMMICCIFGTFSYFVKNASDLLSIQVKGNKLILFIVVIVVVFVIYLIILSLQPKPAYNDSQNVEDN